MIRTTEEIMELLKTRVGDDADDDSLALIEDVSDTLNSLKESEDWKQKYETNDAEWRKKYRDRFFDGNNDGNTKREEDEVPKTRFEDLFITK